MKFPVYVHPRVQQALDASATWWAENRSAQQAERWYDGFVDAILSLDENPTRWPFAPENGAFPYEIRELHYGLGSRPTHRALFTIRPDRVYVLCIRHLAQESIDPQDL